MGGTLHDEKTMACFAIAAGQFGSGGADRREQQLEFNYRSSGKHSAISNNWRQLRHIRQRRDHAVNLVNRPNQRQQPWFSKHRFFKPKRGLHEQHRRSEQLGESKYWHV
jgi:hypothetical protein